MRQTFLLPPSGGCLLMKLCALGFARALSRLFSSALTGCTLLAACNRFSCIPFGGRMCLSRPRFFRQRLAGPQRIQNCCPNTCRKRALRSRYWHFVRCGICQKACGTRSIFSKRLRARKTQTSFLRKTRQASVFRRRLPRASCESPFCSRLLETAHGKRQCSARRLQTDGSRLSVF